MATPMVQAYTKGLKTETRRLKGLEIINQHPNGWELIEYKDGLYFFRIIEYFEGWEEYEAPIGIPCPYGDAGDELIFRETWATEQCYDKYAPNMINALAASTTFSLVPNLWFLADGIKPPWCGKTRSALHLLNDFARFKPLLVARPIPQRLHDITFESARAEGVIVNSEKCYVQGALGLPMRYESQHAFADLWDSLYAARGYPYSGNFWTWPLKFERRGDD